MGILWVALSAFGGGILAALLGWLGSRGEVFDSRKFAASFIRALMAGGAFAITYHLATAGVATGLDIVIAFGTGAGFDALGHRVAKIK